MAARAPRSVWDRNGTNRVGSERLQSGNLIFVPEVYDYAHASWVGVAKRALTPGVPMTLSMIFPGAPSDAVDPVTKNVRIRFSIARFARPNAQWGVMIDRLTARVVPSF